MTTKKNGKLTRACDLCRLCWHLSEREAQKATFAFAFWMSRTGDPERAAAEAHGALERTLTWERRAARLFKYAERLRKLEAVAA